MASHRELLSTAVDCGARQIERLATSKTLVARAEHKRELGSQAEAVDMESYTILAEAARCGVPAVAVRAISDTVDFDMPYDFESARDAQGQIRVMGVLSQVLRRPAGLPDLLETWLAIPALRRGVLPIFWTRLRERWPTAWFPSSRIRWPRYEPVGNYSRNSASVACRADHDARGGVSRQGKSGCRNRSCAGDRSREKY